LAKEEQRLRSPTFPPRSTATLRSAAVGVLGLSVVLCACGGAGSSGTAGGTLTLRLLWERSPGLSTGAARSFEGTTTVPPSAGTIEVLITAPGRPAMVTFSDPSTQQVVIDNVAVGVVTIQVLAYDVPFNDRQQILEFGLPPSFESTPKEVQVAPYQNTNAGTFELLAQPFATDFTPAPGAADVGVRAPVVFLIATAVGAIEPGSINVGIGGVAVVIDGDPQAGASLVPCDDATEQPCSAGANQGLVGFAFAYETPSAYPANASITVAVNAQNTQGRFFAFTYGFTTGATSTTPTATEEIPPTSTPTSTAVAPSPTSSPTVPSVTSTPTPTAPPTRTPTAAPPTRTPTAAPSPSATTAATVTPTLSPTPGSTATATVSATVTATSSATRTASLTPTPPSTATTTRTATVTASSSATRTATPTGTTPPTSTATAAASGTPTETASPERPTETATGTPGEVDTPTPTASTTPSTTPSGTTPTATPSPTAARRALGMTSSVQMEGQAYPALGKRARRAASPAQPSVEEVAV
jgi:hypothetical protein